MADQRTSQTDLVTISEVAARTGFSEPTLRYYEEIGLIPPVPRNSASGHRQYGPDELYVIEALACLHTAGLSVADMRQYMSYLAQGTSAANDLVELFEDHQRKLEEKISQLQTRLHYVNAKIALWEARRDVDKVKETDAVVDLLAAMDGLKVQFSNFW